MKHPFWIANSLLFFLLVFTLVCIYVTRTPLPEREDIEPTAVAPHKKDEVLSINIQKIYEHDLFGTYRQKVTQPEEIHLPVLPHPPKPQILSTPKMPEPQFVDPLNITLKGIVAISTHEEKNRAIIEDKQTKKESTYKVGDTISDAQLIRIFSNKIILLRSNGQQEVLYLREQDAKLDPVYAVISGWENAVQKIDEDAYEINRDEFTLRVKNLVQFIDLINLTTAYKGGQSIGCRIGELEANSLGSYLGLETGDIIITVNGTPTTTTENRLTIYKDIINIQDNNTIEITIVRNDEEHTISFTVLASRQKQKDGETISQAVREQEEKKRVTLQQKYSFAPTIQELRKREKQRMLEHGKAPHIAMPQQEIEVEAQ